MSKLFEQLYEKMKKVNMLEQQPTTIPKPRPVEPDAPPKPKRKRSPTPLKPTPGVHPKPKAEIPGSKDAELFKKARMSVTEMAFDPGRFPSFVHPSKKDWIETGDEELDALFPSLTEGEQSYLEMITSKSYQDMLGRLEKYIGQKAEDIDVPQMLSLVLQSLRTVIKIESKHRNSLEDLALEVVLKLPEFEMVKEAYENEEVNFDIKLGMPELNLNIDMEAEEGELSDAEELNLELTDELEGFSDEKLRRRLANLLIQGSSVLKMYLFNLVSDELEKIDPTLPNLYGLISVIVQLGYWITPSGIEKISTESMEGQMGSEEVIPEGDEYVIKVRALTFPFLVHELTKGIYEWISLDPELKRAMEMDSLEKETEDIIVGSELFKVLTSYIPANKQKFIPLVHKKFLRLPRDQVKSVFAKNIEGKSIMRDLLNQAEEDWEDYQQEKREEELGDIL